ncbi:MAG: hypothetical protein ABIM50_14315 [Novosphingobium sp.]
MAGLAGGLLCPSAAWADNGLQLDVSGGGSYERNPFLLPGDDTDSGAAYIQVDPTYRLTSKVSTVSIGGTLRAEKYFRRYDENLSARLGIDASRRVSSSTTLRGRFAARTSRTTALDFFSAPGALGPGSVPPVLLPDVTVAGNSTRTTELQAGMGFDLDLSQRDQLSADLAASITYFSGPSMSDFRYGSATVNYSRKLSERSSLSFSVRVGVFDYLDRTADDGVTYTPTVGLTTTLGPRVTLFVSGGASVSRVKRIDGSNFSTVAPSLQGKVCYRSENGSTCANAAHDSQPTGLSGLSTVSNFGVSVIRRLNAKDEFSAYASYTLTTRRPEALTTTPAADLLTITGTYSHDLSKKIAAFASPSYTYLTGTGTPRHSNPGMRIGLRVRFGGIE